jgi:nucleoside-diphosphate-sugar epimerase
MSENVLITGINGFVGSALALDQLARGNRVAGIVRDNNHKTRSDVLDRCSITRGDIRDQRLIDDVMS